MIYQIHFQEHDTVLITRDWSTVDCLKYGGKDNPYLEYNFLFFTKETRWGALAKIIKASKEDSFIFILIKHKDTYNNFLNWVKKEELEEYIMYHFPEGVTNPNYPENGRTLVPVVMCSKEHMWREQLKGNHEN